MCTLTVSGEREPELRPPESRRDPVAHVSTKVDYGLPKYSLP